MSLLNALHSTGPYSAALTNPGNLWRDFPGSTTALGFKATEYPQLFGKIETVAPYKGFENLLLNSNAVNNAFGSPLNKTVQFAYGSATPPAAPKGSTNATEPYGTKFFQDMQRYTQETREQQRKDNLAQTKMYFDRYPELMGQLEEMKYKYARKLGKEQSRRRMIQGGIDNITSGIQTMIQGGDPRILGYLAEGPTRIAGGFIQGYNAGLKTIKR